MTSQSLIKGLPPIHPGEYLRDTVIPALETTTQGFAEHIGIGRRTLYDLLQGRTAITASMALRLARATGVRAEMWLNLQQLHDLKVAEAELAGELAAITKIKRRPEDDAQPAEPGIKAIDAEALVARARASSARSQATIAAAKAMIRDSAKVVGGHKVYGRDGATGEFVAAKATRHPRATYQDGAPSKKH